MYRLSNIKCNTHCVSGVGGSGGDSYGGGISLLLI